MSYVDLRCHSAASPTGCLPLRWVGERVTAENVSALAVTDTEGLWGASHLRYFASRGGYKAIFGAEVSVTMTAADHGFDASGPILLLARSATGFTNLNKILTAVWANPAGPSALALEDLARHAEGLFVLTGRAAGPIRATLATQGIGPATTATLALALALPDPDALIVELTYEGTATSTNALRSMAEIARQLDRRVVTTQHALYVDAHDGRAWQLLEAVRAGRRYDISAPAPRNGRHLLSPAAMSEVFGWIPEAVSTSVEIAAAIDGKGVFDFDEQPSLYPQFTASGDDDMRLLVATATAGLDALLAAGDLTPSLAESDYRDRLADEFNWIGRFGCAGAFLTYAEIVKIAQGASILTGPGRSEAAGSLVGRCLDISAVDPVRHGLQIAQVFLHRSRRPQLSLDVDYRHRDRLIGLVVQRFGRDRVAAPLVPRYMPGLRARDILAAAFLPPCPGGPLRAADRQNWYPDPFDPREGRDFGLDETNTEALIRLGRRINRALLRWEWDASRIVIAPEPLHRWTPTMAVAGSAPVAQHAASTLESCGLTAFKIGGFRPLAVISDTRRAAGPIAGARRRCFSEDASDPRVFEMISDGDTAGVHLMHGELVAAFAAQWQLDSIDELAHLRALFHPREVGGGFTASYGERKAAGCWPQHPLPLVNAATRDTLGLLVYIEQLFDIIQCACDCDGETAMRLFREMPGHSMANHGPPAEFVSRAIANGVPRHRATALCTDLGEDWIVTGSKALNVSYARVTYETAWLKHIYPLPFHIAALAHAAPAPRSRLSLVASARRRGIRILGPCVQRSLAGPVAENSAIRMGLDSVGHLGRSGAEELVDERHRGGLFNSVSELASRLGAGSTAVAELEVLAAAGGLDELVSGPPGQRLGERRYAAWSAARSVRREVGALRASMDKAQTGDRSASVASFSEDRVWDDEVRTVGFVVSLPEIGDEPCF